MCVSVCVCARARVCVCERDRERCAVGTFERALLFGPGSRDPKPLSADILSARKYNRPSEKLTGRGPVTRHFFNPRELLSFVRSLHFCSSVQFLFRSPPPKWPSASADMYIYVYTHRRLCEPREKTTGELLFERSRPSASSARLARVVRQKFKFGFFAKCFPLEKERLARNRTSLDGYRPYTWLLEEPTFQSMVIETTATLSGKKRGESLNWLVVP